MIEVTFALFMFLAITLMVAAVLPAAAVSARYGSRYQIAMGIAQHKLDQARAAGHGNLDAAGLQNITDADPDSGSGDGGGDDDDDDDDKFDKDNSDDDNNGFGNDDKDKKDDDDDDDDDGGSGPPTGVTMSFADRDNLGSVLPDGTGTITVEPYEHAKGISKVTVTLTWKDPNRPLATYTATTLVGSTQS